MGGGTFAGTSPRMVYLIFITLFCPVSAKRDPGSLNRDPVKARQFVSYKHSILLCWDDIMPTLQIAPGEIVPRRNILM